MKKIFAFLLVLSVSLVAFAQSGPNNNLNTSEWSTYENHANGVVNHFFRRAVIVEGTNNDTKCMAVMGVLIDPEVGFRIIFTAAPSIGMLYLEYEDAHSGKQMKTTMYRYDLNDGKVSFAIEDMADLAVLLAQPMKTYTLRSDKGGLFTMTTEFNLLTVEELKNALGAEGD